MHQQLADLLLNKESRALFCEVIKGQPLFYQEYQDIAILFFDKLSTSNLKIDEQFQDVGVLYYTNDFGSTYLRGCFNENMSALVVRFVIEFELTNYTLHLTFSTHQNQSLLGNHYDSNAYFSLRAKEDDFWSETFADNYYWAAVRQLEKFINIVPDTLGYFHTIHTSKEMDEHYGFWCRHFTFLLTNINQIQKL